MEMIVVASANGGVGMASAWEILRAGGSALDAVEAATRIVESNEADHSVGVGGYPNAAGEVELDASIMDGSDRRAGSVAALKGYPHPISVARAVLERMPQHVLLVGDGAARWAREQGFAAQELLTPPARAAFEAKLARTAPGALPSVEAAIGIADAPALDLLNEEARDLLALSGSVDDTHIAGTVNFLAIDSRGTMASAVSTSGWAFKYPGRAGDTPVIGAGNYCDGRFGACACTGLGEWAIRAGTARSVVLAMQMGANVDDAARGAMDDLLTIPLPPAIEAIMNLIALDRDGNHVGYTTRPGRTYVWQTESMATYETSARTVVPAS